MRIGSVSEWRPAPVDDEHAAAALGVHAGERLVQAGARGGGREAVQVDAGVARDLAVAQPAQEGAVGAGGDALVPLAEPVDLELHALDVPAAAPAAQCLGRGAHLVAVFEGLGVRHGLLELRAIAVSRRAFLRHAPRSLRLYGWQPHGLDGASRASTLSFTHFGSHHSRGST